MHRQRRRGPASPSRPPHRAAGAHPVARRRGRWWVLAASGVVLTAAACAPPVAGAGPGADAAGPPGTAAAGVPVTSIVAHWREHPDEAPQDVRGATAVLDEVRTGPHVFDLPDLTGATSVVVALSCRQLDAPTVTSQAFRGGDPFGQQWIAALRAAPPVERSPGGAGDGLLDPPVEQPGVQPAEQEYGVASGCTEAGAGSGGYQVERTGVPHRVSVTIGPGVRYSLGVWVTLPAGS